MSEYDGEDLFFGYAIIGNPAFAEWGYISFNELKQIRIPPGIEVDCEQGRRFRQLFCPSVILEDTDCGVKTGIKIEITCSGRPPLSDSGGFRGWMLRIIP
jgi:hypothetical protein